jgi:hypothetical protein
MNQLLSTWDRYQEIFDQYPVDLMHQELHRQHFHIRHIMIQQDIIALVHYHGDSYQ